MNRTGRAILVSCVLATSLPIGRVMGQFNTPDIPICDPCVFPLVADVDMNGSPDLIFTSPDLESITWRANDGTGNFGPDQSLAINQHHLTVRLAVDADGDQDIDLIGAALAPFTDSLVAILRNEDGFYVLDTIDHPMSGTRTLEQLADLDGDGDPDLMSMDHGPEDIWYRNNGDTAWVRDRIPHWCLPVGGPYVTLDAEGDGDVDLARFVVEDSRWVVVWNMGDGRFGPWTWATTTLPQVDLEPGAGKHDVNGDGLEDLVLGGLVSISNGNGTFATNFGLPLQYEYQSIANVNCGDAAEAVLSRSGSATVSIRRLDQTAFVSNINPAPLLPVRNELHDLNGDGRNDLLIGAMTGPGQLWWRDNNAVPPEVTLELPDTIDTLTASTVIDLDLAWGSPPDGGYYSGPGVYDNTFYSGIAGAGDIPITYHYLSFNTQNLCGGSATDTIHVLAITGTPEHARPRLSISPDPADGWIDVRCAVDGISSTRVTDALGRVIPMRSEQTGRPADGIRWITADLPEGAYVLNVLTGAGTRLSSTFLVLHSGH
jgi:hypothetical protein